VKRQQERACPPRRTHSATRNTRRLFVTVAYGQTPLSAGWINEHGCLPPNFGQHPLHLLPPRFMPVLVRAGTIARHRYSPRPWVERQ
jgi:hypothetical protein